MPAMKLEARRLEALRSLNIVNTRAESEFDDLTKLAALICKTPIALISLVEEKRQWFKSKVGLNESETPRDIAFCSHAIQQSDVFTVEDATQDERFKNNPLVTSAPHIRFYAGAPLTLENGLSMGTLCIIDRKPRKLDAEQIEALRTLAKQVVNQMEARQLREMLQASNARFQNLLDSQPAGVIVEDAQRRVLLANSSIYKLFGFDLTMQSLVGLTHEEWCSRVQNQLVDRDGFAQKTLEILASGKPTLGQQFQTQDERWLERDYVPLKVNNCTDSHLWIIRDITERKRTEELIDYQRAQMVETQKLSALGEMAGGLAHEINNPMTVIFGRATLMHELADENRLPAEKALKYSKEIVDVSQRVIKIVKGLRSFARSGESDPYEPASVAEIVSETLEFCRQKIRQAEIELRTPELPADLRLECRPVQISQILLNLINNAFDAVTKLTERWIEIDAVAISDEILVSVTDSGRGIPPELREKIFRPFFTTKESHQGTGLGLAISRRIAEDHGGTLDIDGNSAHTRFVLRLPLKAETKARN